MPAWLKKVIHALVPAGAAALAAAIPVLGALPAAAVAKIAGATFLAYWFKPARPAEPAAAPKP